MAGQRLLNPGAAVVLLIAFVSATPLARAQATGGLSLPGGKADVLLGSSGLPACPQWGARGQAVTSRSRGAAPVGVFTELSAAEMDAVSKFLYAQKALNLTDLSKGKPSKIMNYIHGMWYEMPTKAAVLTHVDGAGSLPARAARVILVMGAAKKPLVQEVLVNLPKPSSYKVVPIHGTPKTTSLPIVYRPYGPADDAGLTELLDAIAPKLNVFIRSAFSGYEYSKNCTKCLTYGFSSIQYLSPEVPRAMTTWLAYVHSQWLFLGNGRFETTDANKNKEGNYLHTIPLQLFITIDGTFLDRWSLGKVWFNFNFIDSIDDLLETWSAPNSTLRSSWEWKRPSGVHALYSGFKPRPGPKRGAAQPSGPVPYEPFGRRFTITSGNKVEWLGWSLNVGLKPSTGLRLFDVRFKGERIAYEIALQEALAGYGAADLAQANTLYLDGHWGMGEAMRELMHGVDCPLNAAYMDSVTWWRGKPGPESHNNSICVFESDSNTPVLRHFSYANDFYGAQKGWTLTIRVISQVYNYDYIMDTILNVDGTFEKRVVTSGYVQANAHNPKYPSRFGYPVTFGIGGTIHTHQLAWKVDLDIAGVNNSMNIHEVKYGSFSDNGLGTLVASPFYERITPETELATAILPNYDTPKIPVVVNEAATNKWGAPRGYKVLVNRPQRELMPADAPYKRSLGFARFAFAATQYKPSETVNSSPYNQVYLSKPVVAFETFLNAEPARKTDLVAWVSAGLFHIPMAEDAPVTPTTANPIGFSLIPYNWADENPATDMADMVYVTATTPTTALPSAAGAIKCSPRFASIPFQSDNKFD